MRRLSVLIFIAAALVFTGCEEETKKSAFNENSVTLADLMPTQGSDQRDKITFKIFTFQIPIENYHLMKEAFDSLDKRSMRFSNRKSFIANGFDAGAGNEENWRVIGNCLQMASAKRAKVSTLMVHDEKGNDYLIGNLTEKTAASYFTISRDSKTVTLEPGLLGWRINSHLVGGQRDLSQVKIQGLYKPTNFNMITRLPREALKDIIPNFKSSDMIIKPSSVIMNMNEGDFIMLGGKPGTFSSKPQEDDLGETETTALTPQQRLVDLFFTTYATMNLPKKAEEKSEEGEESKAPDEIAEVKDDQIYFERVKNVPIAEVFIIAFMGVGN